MSSAQTCNKNKNLYIAIDGNYFPFGQYYAGTVDGLNELTITKELVDGREHISCNEMTFYGGYYDYLKAKLIDSNDKDASVYVKIFDPCCSNSGQPSVAFEGRIYANAITWCSQSCSIQANIIQKTTDTDLETCFANTMIWDNDYGFQDIITHPKVEYCLDYKPRLLHYIVISLVITLLPMLGLIRLVTMTIDPIIAIVCALASCSDELKNGISDDIETMEAYLTEWAIGCGKYHPAPYVRDYIQNVCKICGNRLIGMELPFSSSILNDAYSKYYELVLFSNPVAGGEYYELGGIWGSSSLHNWIHDDRPINSGSQFLDRLNVVFNAKWAVINSVLHFERKDWFKTVYSKWLDLNDPQYDIVGDGYCISWLDEDVPSYLNIAYASDAVEIEGQRKMPNYFALVDYNPTHNVIQKGERKVVFDFGSSSFADGSDFFSPMRSGAVDAYLNFYGADDVPEDVLILSQDTGQYDKLIVINTQSFINGELGDPKKEHVVARKEQWGTIFNNELSPAYTRQDHSEFPTANLYNYPMQINPRYPGNLYTNFHFIDEPWNTIYKRKSLEVTVLATCDMIQASTVKRAVGTPYGEMECEKIEIKYKDKTMKLTGKI